MTNKAAQVQHGRPRSGRTGGERADAERVLAGVLEAAESLRGTASFRPPPSCDADFQAILRVLAYCYANGIYASTEIESALNVDPILLYLTGGQRHKSTEFRQFRRRNLQAIQRCLARTLERSWGEANIPSLASRQPPGGYAQAAFERLCNPPPRPDFDTEAADRVRKAICDDTALLDE